MMHFQRLKFRASQQARFILLLLLQAAFFGLVFLFLALPELLAQTNTGVIQITSISGASAVDDDLKTFYGGTTQTGDGFCPASTSLCNSCTGTGTGMEPCNENEVTDNNLLSITFTWNGENISNTRLSIGVASSSSETPQPPAPVQPIVNLIKGQSYTVTSEWNRICRMTNCANDCRSCTQGEYAGTLYIGVDQVSDGKMDDSNNISINAKYHRTDTSTTVHCPETDVGPSGNAVCFFDIFPGDKKLYLDRLTYTSDFPTGGTVGWAGIDIFYTTGNGAGTLSTIRNNSEGVFYSVANDSDKDFKVVDLENDTSYCVILGARSKAGNITNFYPSATEWASAPAGRYCGTPQEVYGLLDSKKCFIATASFGSEMDAHVQKFREFRDRFLTKTTWGKELVVLYYKKSPAWAAWLEANPIFKPISRGLLWILLVFIEIYLAAGSWALVASILSALFISALVVRIAMRSRPNSLKINKESLS